MLLGGFRSSGVIARENINAAQELSIARSWAAATRAAQLAFIVSILLSMALIGRGVLFVLYFLLCLVIVRRIAQIENVWFRAVVYIFIAVCAVVFGPYIHDALCSIYPAPWYYFYCWPVAGGGLDCVSHIGITRKIILRVPSWITMIRFILGVAIPIVDALVIFVFVRRGFVEIFVPQMSALIPKPSGDVRIRDPLGSGSLRGLIESIIMPFDIGQRQEAPAPQPVTIEITARTSSGANVRYENFPGGLEALRKLSRAVMTGTPLTESAMGGGRVFSTQEWRTIKSFLLNSGFAEPVNQRNSRSGIRLTNNGQALIEAGGRQ